MQSDYPLRETIRERLERDLNAIRSLLADARTEAGELVLERLPSGDYAWLRPDVDKPIPFVLTERGRRVLDHPKSAGCPACGRPQSSPSCERREHWGVA